MTVTRGCVRANGSGSTLQFVSNRTSKKMASGVSLLSEDQLLCPICLGVFVEPVSTPCGHNFCMSCLSSYWNSSPVCLCPICKESFSLRPQLRVNTFISGLSQSFSSLQLRQEPQTSVLCDVCTFPRDALKSCVECLSSFCSDHLEPHHRVPGLRRHTLVPPDSSLQDRVCPQHQELLRSYCTEEGALLCASCEGAHSKHKTLPLEQAYRKLSTQLEHNKAKVSSLIQERVQSVCSLRETIAQRHEETRRVITQSEQVLQDVLKKVQKSHQDLVQKIEEKQQQVDSEAEALIVQTEQEIADLRETQTKLQELKQMEDPLLFQQKHPNMSMVSQNSLSTLSLKDRLEEMSLESFTSRIKEFLEEFDKGISFCDEKQSALKPLQKCKVDLRLDADTAHPQLLLSPDLKQVWFNKRGSKAPGNNSRRFLGSYAVITDRGFSYGRFYFEVSVGQKEEWVLGLIAESVSREKVIPKDPDCGVWALYFRVDKFYTYSNRNDPVHSGRVEQVGVFVDCERGLLSFYDVKTATCIYTFNNYIFEEKVFPFLNPCDDEFQSNSGPMTILDPK